MSPVDNIERRIEQLHLGTRTETDKRILDDAFAALQKGLRGQRAGIWQSILASRMPRPVATAAVVLIAVALFLSRPARNAETIEGFYNTLAEAQNICISEFQAGQASPDQQVWTSQSLKVRLFRTEIGDKPQFALLDIGRKTQMTVYLSTVQTEDLTEQKLRALEESMKPSFALAPFFDAKDIPKDARWTRVSDPAVVALVPGCVVYDLTWTQPGAASPGGSQRRWRVFVDAGTHRPRRTEFHSKSESQEQFKLERFVVVTYPSETDIRDIVARTFGPSPGQTSGPEYIGTPGIDR